MEQLLCVHFSFVAFFPYEFQVHNKQQKRGGKKNEQKESEDRPLNIIGKIHLHKAFHSQ